MELLKRFIHEGDCVIDVGANVGVYTWEMSRLVGEAGLVWAFEPVRMTFEILRNNTDDLRNVYCYGLALGNGYGTKEINLFALKGGEPDLCVSTVLENTIVPRKKIGTEIICITPLDVFFTGKPSFIKIDVEGFEFDAILGMRGILRRHHPVLLVEIWNPHSPVFRFMAEWGYTCFIVKGRELVERAGYERSASANYFFLNP